MKWLDKIVEFIKKEMWWRIRYKRITLDEEETWGGICIQCHAATGELQCNLNGRNCPCEWNQCLKLRKYVGKS